MGINKLIIYSFFFIFVFGAYLYAENKNDNDVFIENAHILAVNSQSNQYELKIILFLNSENKTILSKDIFISNNVKVIDIKSDDLKTTKNDNNKINISGQIDGKKRIDIILQIEENRFPLQISLPFETNSLQLISSIMKNKTILTGNNFSQPEPLQLMDKIFFVSNFVKTDRNSNNTILNLKLLDLGAMDDSFLQNASINIHRTRMPFQQLDIFTIILGLGMILSGIIIYLYIKHSR